MKVEYTKRKQEDQEVLRQQDLASLKKIVAEMPAATRKSKLVVGERSFTPDEMVKEAENGTEYGATFLKMLSRMRLETLRKG